MSTYAEVLRRRYEGILEERRQRDRGEEPRTLIKSGLRAFDSKAGIERSILTVIGAATGEGKSIFKKHLQESAAATGLKCLDLSFEDPPDRSADRSFSTVTGVNNAKLALGEVTDKELAQIAVALSDMEEWAERIEYHYGLKSADEALAIVRASDADLVQVDYAQAFPDGERGLERTISQFAWDLNVDAQERSRATIIYSQLTAEVERRGLRMYESSRRNGEVNVDGFRPFAASDLAWSTALGQRAKGLGFLFRPGRYRRRFGENARDDRMELIWPKKNFGAEGAVTVGFDGKTARLFNLDDKGD